MHTVEIMIKEHEMISRMTQVMRKACLNLLQNQQIDSQDFKQMIDFVKNYADAHHHGKEEKFLFKEMEEQLGAVGQKLIRHGMLVEHDLGRLYISQLQGALEKIELGDEESKLDIIANAVGYANLLSRHIQKENEVIYTFAEKHLAPEIKERLDAQTIAFEETADKEGVPQYYLDILSKLEKKY